MKKIILLISFILITGCSVGDEGSGIMQELVPVVSVELPETLTFRQTHEIVVTFKKPSTCHSFSGFDIQKDENEITVGVVTSFDTNNNNCETTGNLTTSARLNFVADRDDFYIFKFWQGENEDGDVQFLIKEVPVSQPGI